MFHAPMETWIRYCVAVYIGLLLAGLGRPPQATALEHTPSVRPVHLPRNDAASDADSAEILIQKRHTELSEAKPLEP